MFRLINSMLRSISRVFNRKLQLLFLATLTFTLYYFDLKLIIGHDVIPPYKTRCNLNSAKLLIENLVIQLYLDFANKILACL